MHTEQTLAGFLDQDLASAMRHELRAIIVLLICGHTIATAQSSGTFSGTGKMTMARSGHTATLLPNGKVLLAGGRQGIPGTLLDSADLYDPAQGTFTATGHMITGRYSTRPGCSLMDRSSW